MGRSTTVSLETEEVRIVGSISTETTLFYFCNCNFTLARTFPSFTIWATRFLLHCCSFIVHQFLDLMRSVASGVLVQQTQPRFPSSWWSSSLSCFQLFRTSQSESFRFLSSLWLLLNIPNERAKRCRHKFWELSYFFVVLCHLVLSHYLINIPYTYETLCRHKFCYDVVMGNLLWFKWKSEWVRYRDGLWIPLGKGSTSTGSSISKKQNSQKNMKLIGTSILAGVVQTMSLVWSLMSSGKNDGKTCSELKNETKHPSFQSQHQDLRQKG